MNGITSFKKFLLFNGLLISSFTLSYHAYAQQENVALKKQVKASSENPSFPASNLVDGKSDTLHAWLANRMNASPLYAEIDLHKYQKIQKTLVYLRKNLPQNLLQEIKLQYWDDANWTNIIGKRSWDPSKGILTLQLPASLTTFMVRIYDEQSPSLFIREIEVYGKEAGELAYAGDLQNIPVKTPQQALITVNKKITGKSLKYVGYNQGYYLPGTNVSSWVAYSNINTMRVWTSLSDYAPIKAFKLKLKVADANEFDSLKRMVRNNPEGSPFIKWDMLKKIYENDSQSGANRMNFYYTLTELKRLHVDALLQMNERFFKDDWTNKWQQWLRFYTLSYYAAKVGGVGMFAMQNEPNHVAAGPMKPEVWLRGLQLASDATKCAVSDVNRQYHSAIQARFAAPITAGYNTDWWAYAVSHIHENYKGETTNTNLFDIFSTHSYNQPASGYATRVTDIRKVIIQNHPEHQDLPIVFTEIGRWMNSLLINKKETYDSPSVFTEWAGIYANNMKNGAYGMWAFKFSNTTSSTYPEGIKSGHHFTWQGKRIIEDAYTNFALNSKVIVVSGGNQQHAEMITDNDKTDQSTWISDSTATKKIIDIKFEKGRTVNCISIYSGSSYGVYTGPERIKKFQLFYRDGQEWKPISGTSSENNKYTRTFIPFGKPVNTGQIRLEVEDPGRIKIREIKLFNIQNLSSLPENYNISGIQRTGEVIRLFAKGFKNERPLMETIASVQDKGFDHYTAYDTTSNNYYMWLVQRGLFNYNLNIDLSALGLQKNAFISAELVNQQFYGEITRQQALDEKGKIKVVLPAQSVMLLTIPAGTLQSGTILCSADAKVQGGSKKLINYGHDSTMKVELNAPKTSQNQVSYLQFDLPDHFEKIRKAILSFRGQSEGSNAFRIHIYAIPRTNWQEDRLTWKTAPELATEEALINSEKGHAFICGEVALGQTLQEHSIDVTRIMRKFPAKKITFVLIREAREPGDDMDKDRKAVIMTKESGNPPSLHYWYDKP